MKLERLASNSRLATVAIIGVLGGTILGITACQPHSANTNSILKPSQGWTSGGGNATSAKTAADDEIRASVAKAQYWMPYIFNAMSFDTISMAKNPEQPRGDNYQKLFGTAYGNEPIQTALKSMTIHLEEEKPCISPLGEEDGAAYRDGSICISLQRLRGKLNSDTAFVEIASLVGRESSHLVGVGERGADLIQAQIKTLVHEELLKVESPQALIPVFETPSWISTVIWQTGNEIRDGASEGQICMALESVISQEQKMVDGFQQASIKFGAWPISSMDYDYFAEVLWFKLKVVSSQYCGGDTYAQAALTKIFANTSSKSVEVADLEWLNGNTYHSIYDDPRHRPMTDVMVNKITSGDHAALTQELKDIQAVANRMAQPVEYGSGH